MGIDLISTITALLATVLGGLGRRTRGPSAGERRQDEGDCRRLRAEDGGPGRPAEPDVPRIACGGRGPLKPPIRNWNLDP